MCVLCFRFVFVCGTDIVTEAHDTSTCSNHAISRGAVLCVLCFRFVFVCGTDIVTEAHDTSAKCESM